MIATHFKITRLPSKDVVSRIGADPLIKDQLYAIERETEIYFSRNEKLEGYYHQDTFEYQAYDETTDRYSNPVESTIKWIEDNPATAMVSSTSRVTMIQADKSTLLEMIPINKSVEYIEVISTGGVVKASNNGMPVSAGHKLSPSDLNKATLTILPLGGGRDYFSLEYKLGKGSQLSDETYWLLVDVDTLAGIAVVEDQIETAMITDENGYSQEYATQTSTIRLSGADSLSTVTLAMTTDYPWLLDDPDNYVEINVGSNSSDVDAPTDSFNRMADTSIYGTLDITVIVYFKYDSSKTYSGSLSIDIVDIGGYTGYISPDNNTVTLPTNL